MTRMLKTMLCVLLSVLMLISVIPMQAMAAEINSDKPITLQTANGDVEVSDSWEDEYPYGCFAFDKSEAVLVEGGDTFEIPVYRLGGIIGRATAFIIYNPTITPTEDENKFGYSFALSSDDIEIEAQDPSPCAQYDPIGKDPEPEESGTKVTKVTDGDDLVFSVSVSADKYQWQGEIEGRWKNLQDENKSEFRIAKKDYQEYDVRCVYWKGDVSYCTDTANGVKYVKPEEEVPPEAPADLDLTPATTFTKLVPDESDPFLSYVIPLTFADGEWIKTIRITAKEDDISECVENASLIISDCAGGAINDAVSSMNVTVTDNDPAEPFEIGLTETEGTFDKAEGYAVFTVRRTGGNQEPVTLHYQTFDGTAVKGEDYMETTGEISLYGDAMEMKIAIPLIDDGVKDDKKKTLTLRLSELKGDSENLCTLLETEATAYIYNSGTGKGDNLATKLRDSDAIDLEADEASAGVANINPSTVTGTQKETRTIKAEIVRGKANSGGQKTYTYSDYLEFPRDAYGADGYWTDTVNAFDAGYRFDRATGGVDTYAGKGDGYSILINKESQGNAYVPIPYLTTLYQKAQASLNIWPYRNKLCPWIAFGNTSDANSCDPNHYSHAYCSDHEVIEYHYSADFDKSDNLNMMIMGFTSGTATGIDDGEIVANNLTFERRAFTRSNNLYLTVHTANDGVSSSQYNGFIPTAPDGAFSLNSDNLFKEIKPEITIVSGAGGVNENGCLYVGTKLNININTTGTFSSLKSDQLSACVYLTDSDGKTVATAEKGNGDNYTLELLWDDMKLSDTFYINVVMSRKQNVTIDLTPSVPRSADDKMRPDMGRTEDAISAFMTSNPNNSNNNNYTITYGVSETLDAEPYFSTEMKTVTLNMNSNPPPYTEKIDEKNSTLKLELNENAVEDNIQWINFNRSPDDLILYNGNSYQGNETIWLTLEDISSKDLHFYYYSQDSLYFDSLMNASVDKVGLYLDGDNDKRISGAVNEVGGFTVDENSKDVFVGFLDPDTNYIETMFNPIQNEDGEYCQYFLKIFYHMNPRSLNAPDEEHMTYAQVLPAFVSSITDSDNFFALTTEQQNYRYLVSGLSSSSDEGDIYTSDGHIMFGAEATKLQFVDAPLGGDQSPVTYTQNSDGTVEYSWTPDYSAYKNNLLYPYADPEQIVIEKSIAGDNIPISGSDNTNGYLGSFTMNNTAALCVRQQDKTVAQIITQGSAKKGAKSADEILAVDTVDESATAIPNKTMPDPSSQLNLSSEEGGYDSIDTADADNAKSRSSGDGDFNVNMQTALDQLKFNFWVAEIAKKDDELILGISLPLGRWQSDRPKSLGPVSPVSPAQNVYQTKWLDPMKNDLQKFADGFGIFKALDKNQRVQTYNDLYQGYGTPSGGRVLFGKWQRQVGIYIAFHFKYDNALNTYDLKNFMVGGFGSMSCSYTVRPVALPFFFLTVTAFVSASLITGGQMIRTYKEGDLQTPVSTNGNVSIYKIKRKMVNLTFSGKVKLGLYEDQACTKQVDHSKSGELSSTDGSKPTTINMLKKATYSSGDKDKTYYLRVERLSNNTSISRLVEINSMSTDLEWNGMELTLDTAIEVDAGVDFLVAKAELVGKVSFGVTVLWYEKAHNPLSKAKTNLLFKDVKFYAGLLARVNIVFFTYTFNIVGWQAEYKYGEGWKKTYIKPSTQFEKGVSASSDYDTVIALPDDATDTQKVYRQQEKEDTSWLKAFTPTDRRVPFELSGYSSSSDSAKLADGLMGGSDYQVVTLTRPSGDSVNYVFYHLSRDDADSTIDNSMLVMSELVMTGVKPGLLNPVDPESETPYIPVDDDGTGDIDFHIEPAANGQNLKVTWSSYQSTTPAGAQASLETFSDAVKNTEIKTATFTPGTGFGEVKVISRKAGEKTNEYVGMPVTMNNTSAYVRSNHMDDENIELNNRTEFSRYYLSTIGYDPDSSNSYLSDIGVYRLSTQRSLWTQGGKSSDICVKAPGGDTAYVELDDGVTVQNIAGKEINGTYYIAYTTKQDFYTTADGDIVDIDFSKKLSTDEINTLEGQIGNMLSIKRLYLRTFTLDDDGKVVWGMDGKSVLLRTLFDYDNGGEESGKEGTLPDGVYKDRTQIESKNDPYFNNIQFLSANLGDSLTGTPENLPLTKGTRDTSVPENFLLFDMSGSTYLIRQDSLENMTGQNINQDKTTTTGTIIPFFTPDVSDTTDNGATSATGRLETTIGADGDGNLVAVYTTSVKNTADTALCISKYDPSTGWGSKTMLAMNHLGVYEDNEKLNRVGEEAEKAYLGLLDEDEDGNPDKDQKGSMDQFVFRNPQIALGEKTVTDSSGRVSKQGTLLVLTQGTMTYLGYKDVEDSDGNVFATLQSLDASEVTLPDSDSPPPGSGIYALAYGVGSQEVGNATMSMDTYDFSAGSNEGVTLSFENTGDVGIRGSEDQPITVSLMAKGNSAPLAQWTLTENIVPGQEAKLSGLLNLSNTLPVGTELYLNVAEDDFYQSQGGKPFNSDSNVLLTVEDYPELSITNSNIAFDSIDEDGNAVIDVEFTAENRGTAEAKNVKAIFSYDTGTVDGNGNEIFETLDLSHSNLNLKTQGSIGLIHQSHLADGELDLMSMKVGGARHVIGTITIPPECFNEQVTKALNLKIELFSDGDEGLPDGEHKEYNSNNNILTQHVEHRTIFNAPARITIPVSSEMRIPISCQYSTGEDVPRILITEFPDIVGETHFKKLAFRYGEFGGGSGFGALGLKPDSLGSGYIRIKDLSTNSFYDIAYHITDSEPGINIYNDNDYFTFEGTNWTYQSDISAWGVDQTAPYEGDLACGLEGSSFSFETLAESIDLVFNGEVTVTVDDRDPITVSAKGGSGDSEESYATVNLGRNLMLRPRLVTVTVKKGASEEDRYAYFDRLIERFSSSQLPVPSEDVQAPQIFFSRSFPETASLAPGAKADIQAYIFDETGVTSFTVNGKTVTPLAGDDIKFWTVDLPLDRNGTYTLAAVDDMGNQVTHDLQVDWYSDSSENEVSAVPEISATLMKRGEGEEEDAELTDDISFTDDDSAYIKPEGTASDGEDAPVFSVTEVTASSKAGLAYGPVEADEDQTFPVYANGWYIVQATDPDSDGNVWSATVVEMMRLTKPQLYITADELIKYHGEDEPDLTYQARGLLPGDTLSGSQVREEGDELGTYAITQGTLTPGYAEDYRIVYQGAELTIKHDFRNPTWEWDDSYEVVTINIDDVRKIDIQSDCYIIDDDTDNPIAKDSAHTKYVLTGTIDHPSFDLLIHDHEYLAATYNIFFYDLNVLSFSGDFITVNGNKANVNLSLIGRNTLKALNHIFARGDFVGPASANDPTFNIYAKANADGICNSEFSTTNGAVSDDGINFTPSGEFTVSYADGEGDFSRISTSSSLNILSSDPDLYVTDVNQYVATVTFNCPACEETHILTDPAILYVNHPATCGKDAYEVLSAQVTFEGEPVTDKHTYVHEGTALDHDYVARVVDPTCTEQGYTINKCTHCGDSYKDSYTSALGHDYVPNVTDATCTEEGCVIQECSRCGDSYQDSIIPPLGHDFGVSEWKWNGFPDTVEITVADNMKVDIHPDRYIINGGEPVARDSADTQYIFTGSAKNFGITVHDGDEGAGNYFICLKNVNLDYSYCDYSLIRLRGHQTCVNLSLSGNNRINIVASDYIGINSPADAKIKIATTDKGQTTFKSDSRTVLDGVRVEYAGFFTVLADGADIDSDDLQSAFRTSREITLTGGVDHPDPFGFYYNYPVRAKATITCSRCGETHTKEDWSPSFEEGIAATCTEDAYDQYTATVTYEGSEFTGTYRIPKPGTALGHDFGEPVWFWNSSWDVVTLDMSDGKVVDIHPTYYTVNGGEEIEKDSAFTRYVITGDNTSNADNRLILHDSEDSETTYNICLRDLRVYESTHDFIKVKGEKATVNLYLCGSVTLVLSDHVFSSDADDTVFNIGVEEWGYASFTSSNSTVADDKVILNQVGDYNFLWARDLSEFVSKQQASVYSVSDHPDPFPTPYTAFAEFTCTRCEHKETVAALVTEEVTDDITYRVLTVEFNGNTYTKRYCLSRLLGDVDGDGEVTVLDATAIQKKLALLAIEYFDEDLADTDGDGEVTVLDATAVQKHIALLPAPEGIGKPVT